jgi:hypothetical protein
MATEYLRGVPDCFLARDDVPGSMADMPAFLTRTAKNIDQVAREWQRRGHISTHRDKRMIRCIRPLKIGDLKSARLRGSRRTRNARSPATIPATDMAARDSSPASEFIAEDGGGRHGAENVLAKPGPTCNSPWSSARKAMWPDELQDWWLTWVLVGVALGLLGVLAYETAERWL